jgi:hypothetical protein
MSVPGYLPELSTGCAPEIIPDITPEYVLGKFIYYSHLTFFMGSILLPFIITDKRLLTGMAILLVISLVSRFLLGECLISYYERCLLKGKADLVDSLLGLGQFDISDATRFWIPNAVISITIVIIILKIIF